MVNVQYSHILNVNKSNMKSSFIWAKGKLFSHVEKTNLFFQLTGRKHFYSAVLANIDQSK